MEVYELFNDISNENILLYSVLFIIIIIIGSIYNHNISYYFIIIIIYLLFIYYYQINWYNNHNISNKYKQHIDNQINLYEDSLIKQYNDIKLFLHDMIFISYYSLQHYNNIIKLIEKYLLIYEHIVKDIDIINNISSIQSKKLSKNQKILLIRDMKDIKNKIINDYNNIILILPNDNRIIDKYNNSIKILIDILDQYYNNIKNRQDMNNLIETHYINSYNYDNYYNNYLDSF